MTRVVRQQRRGLFLLRRIPNTVRAFGWAGPKSFKKALGHKRFDLARTILNGDREFESLCTAIGFIELNWALLEQSLDNWVAIIFHDVDGKPLAYEERLPREFGRKARFLKRCFKKLSPLQPFAEEGLLILEKAKTLSATRHDLSHGVATSITPVRGVFPFSVIKHEAQHHIVRDFVFNPKDFPKLAKALLDLGAESLRFGERLGIAFAKQ